MIVLQRLRQVAVRTQIVQLEIMGKLLDDIRYRKSITMMLLSSIHYCQMEEKPGKIQKVMGQRHIRNKLCRAI